MPTIQKITGPYRFYFYSFDCSEPVHIHVQRERMVCKFWLEPITLANNYGFSAKELNQIRKLIRNYIIEIRDAWHEHCG